MTCARVRHATSVMPAQQSWAGMTDVEMDGGCGEMAKARFSDFSGGGRIPHGSNTLFSTRARPSLISANRPVCGHLPAEVCEGAPSRHCVMANELWSGL